MPVPEYRLWEEDAIIDIRNHAGRCTYEPRGTNALSSDCIFVCSSRRRFWRFKATVSCLVPFTATAVLVQQSGGVSILLTTASSSGRRWSRTRSSTYVSAGPARLPRGRARHEGRRNLRGLEESARSARVPLDGVSFIAR
jgi:hypothetical protein